MRRSSHVFALTSIRWSMMACYGTMKCQVKEADRFPPASELCLNQQSHWCARAPTRTILRSLRFVIDWTLPSNSTVINSRFIVRYAQKYSDAPTFPIKTRHKAVWGSKINYWRKRKDPQSSISLKPINLNELEKRNNIAVSHESLGFGSGENAANGTEN